jgi:ATP-dependent 26S proteasome regulatory subunit
MRADLEAKVEKLKARVIQFENDIGGLKQDLRELEEVLEVHLDGPKKPRIEAYKAVEQAIKRVPLAAGMPQSA